MTHRNTVELLGTYGGDITHAMSAWTSTSRDLDIIEPKTGQPRRSRIPALLNMLAEQGHHTPFEKSALHFLVVCDKATHIQLLKHRIGVSVNGESARYKELKEDKWYTPDDWPERLRTEYNSFVRQQHDFYHYLMQELEREGISRKRAKESARLVLPHASQIVQDIQFNFRSFMHLVGLRVPSDAQREVRLLAAEMLMQVAERPEFTASLAAFGWTPERLDELNHELAV